MMSFSNGRRSRITHPRDILMLLKHRIDVAGLSALIIIFVTLWLFLLMPRSYDSQTQMLVRIGRESMRPDPTVTLGPTIGVTQTRQSELNSEAMILQSLDLLERVAEDLSDGNQSMFKLVEEIEKGLRIRIEEESNIITVEYRSRDANDAQRTLGRVVARYLEKHAQTYGNPANEDFFIQRSDEISKRIDVERAQLKEKLDVLGAHSLAEHQRTLYARSAAVQTELDATLSALTVARARFAQTEISLESSKKMMVLEETENPSAFRTEIERQLVALRLREQQLLTNYGADTDVVKNVREQIKLAQDTLKSRGKDRTIVRRGINANRQGLERERQVEKSNIAGLAAKKERLFEQQCDVAKQIDALHKAAGPLAAVEARITVLEETRSRYLAGLEQARTDAAMASQQLTNISIIQAPTLPTSPSGPPRIWIVVVGAFLALTTGLGAALVVDFFDSSLQTPDDVRAALDREVVAALRSHRGLEVPIERRFDSEHVIALPVTARRDLNFLVGDALSSSAERTVFAVTGAQEQSGNSTFAFHFASRLAAAGAGTVVLVDASDSPRNLTRALECEPKQAVQSTGVEGLSVLPRWREACSIDETLAALNIQAADARYVVFDLPPLSANGGALEFARQATKTFLTVSPDTDVSVARRSLQSLGRGSVKVLGVVLSRQELAIGSES